MIDLQNPISIEMSVMRNSLWPGLLNNLSHNIKRQNKNIKIFEIGKHFSSKNKTSNRKKRNRWTYYGNRRLGKLGISKKLLSTSMI